MIEYLRLLYEGATEVSPDEVMGALMVGLALALACYGLCALGRTRSANPLPLLCGLFFLVSASEIDQAYQGPVGPPPIQYFHPDTYRPGRGRIEKTSYPPMTGSVGGPDQGSTGTRGPLDSTEGTRAADSRSGPGSSTGGFV